MSKENKILLKKIKSFNEEQKEFIKLMNNYAIGLCISNDSRSINELCEIIKCQNERRLPK